jgi:hypothetical protein
MPECMLLLVISCSTLVLVRQLYISVFFLKKKILLLKNEESLCVQELYIRVLIFPCGCVQLYGWGGTGSFHGA